VPEARLPLPLPGSSPPQPGPFASPCLHGPSDPKTTWTSRRPSRPGRLQPLRLIERDKGASAWVLGQIERNFGKGSIMRLASIAPAMRVGNRVHRRRSPWICALGGGYHQGTAVVEVYGPRKVRVKPPSPALPSPRPSASGGVAAIRRREMPLILSMPLSCGVDVEKFCCVSQPDTGEMALEIC